MVGFDWKQDYHLSPFWQGVSGVCSGMITRFLCQPLDVLKIRFQLQHEPLKQGQESYYWSLKQASSRILREETYRAMWKGHVPAQILSGVYGLAQVLARVGATFLAKKPPRYLCGSKYSIRITQILLRFKRELQFSSFEFLTKTVHLHSYNHYNTPVVHFICGSLSGGVATFFSMPFDTIRTRLVSQGEPKTYRGLFDALKTIVKVDGIEGLYRGLIPTILQILPYAGLQFAFFELFSQTYYHVTAAENTDKLPVLGSLLCGSAAGIMAKTAVYPLDLTKKRVQVQGFEAARKQFGKVKTYQSWRHCIIHTVAKEGYRGLFKGLTPSVIKAMATTGLTFTLYEEISNMLRNLHV